MKKAAKKFLAWMTALGFVLGSASAMEPAENGENTGINGGDTCNHVLGDPVRDIANEIPSTCQEPGFYDMVWYCTICGQEVFRESIDLEDLAPHTPGDAVKENIISATCTEDGSYDLVRYCTVCEEEVSRETVVVKAAHTPGEAVKENETPATCEHPGGYDLVQYCMVCGEELSGVHIELEQKAHVVGEGVRENEKVANCDGPESYDLVKYCSVCGAELSRQKITVGEAVHVPSDPEDDGKIYCAACGELLGFAPDPDPAPAPDPAPEPEPAPAPAPEPEPVPAPAPKPEPAPAPAPKPEPVPVLEPARPVTPVSPVSPADSAATNYAMKQITDVDAFTEDLIIDLAKDGKTLAVDADSLKAVLNGVNNPNNPAHEPISVENAVEALGSNYKSYRTNGKEAQDDPDLSEYCFLCGFEQLKLQDKQETDRYGNPLPFEVKTAFPALADLKPAEINNTVMLVLNPESGQIALIPLDMSCFDVSKVPPELNVTLPFDGLVTFVQK